MTICNMSIEAGARAGMVAPDATTFEFLKGRPHAPTGADWDAALAHWRTLASDPDAVFDREIVIDAATLAPMISWGTSPEHAVAIDGHVPADAEAEANTSSAASKIDARISLKLESVGKYAVAP